MIRFILRKIIIILMFISVRIFTQDIDTIIQSQIKYFQRIYSLQMEIKGCTVNSEEIAKIAGGKDFQVEGKFFQNGSKYRVELLDKRIPYIIKTYNGEKIQVLQITKGIRILFLKDSLEEDNNPYLGMNIIVEWYRFVFENGNKISVETLQAYNIWKKFQRSIKRISEDKMFGHKGVEIEFEKIGNSGKLEKNKVFFAEDLDYFPIYWEETDSLSNSLCKMTLTNFKKYEVENGKIIVPLRIECVRYRNKRVIQNEWWEIDEKSLKINQPIKDEIFTIPISQADRIYDAQTDTWFKLNK